MVEDGAFSHKIDYVTILNLEGPPNRITGSRVATEWVDLPIGGASAVEDL